MDASQNISEETGTVLHGDENSSPILAKEWITVDEAVVLFRDLGLPRSPEAIRGYCRDEKIEATTTQGIKGEQHVIKRKGAEVYIKERKKVLDAMTRDNPSSSETSRKIPVHSVTFPNMPKDTGMSLNDPTESEELKLKAAEIAKLRDEVMSLRIDKSARDQIVSMLREERSQIASEAMEKSRRVGELEAMLRLTPPGERTVIQHAREVDMRRPKEDADRV